MYSVLRGVRKKLIIVECYNRKRNDKQQAEANKSTRERKEQEKKERKEWEKIEPKLRAEAENNPSPKYRWSNYESAKPESLKRKEDQEDRKRMKNPNSSYYRTVRDWAEEHV